MEGLIGAHGRGVGDVVALPECSGATSAATAPAQRCRGVLRLRGKSGARSQGGSASAAHRDYADWEGLPGPRLTILEERLHMVCASQQAGSPLVRWSEGP